jgi:uncharacterized membrane protein YdbT with pleckstrin-like domain
MLDWLTWPANLLLNTAAVIESWFVSKASVNFGLIQMALAVLLLAAVVALIAYWQWLVQWVVASLRSRRGILEKKRGTSRIDLDQ